MMNLHLLTQVFEPGALFIKTHELGNSREQRNMPRLIAYGFPDNKIYEDIIFNSLI